METVFPLPQPVTVPVRGSAARFPVRRIFCVGRNYADHALEMGALDQASGKEPPFFFYKPTDALVTGSGELSVVYPPQTEDLHHEVEMVVALQTGGVDIAIEQAPSCIFGYGIGLDLTRRDVQAKAKAKSHPWDMGKGFDQSAVCGELTPAGQCHDMARGSIWLKRNGELRQNGNLDCMAWKVAQIIAVLSQTVRLEAGDLIYTGTPAGVGPIVPGDCLLAGVDGLGELAVVVLPRA